MRPQGGSTCLSVIGAVILGEGRGPAMNPDEAWEKGETVEGYDPDIIRKDEFGAWIYREHLGKESHFGWMACSRGPLQWKNAAADGGSCEVTSNGRRNVEVGWVEV